MTNTLHTDYELVALYSIDFADQYKKAKSIASLAPKGCLTDLRILVERLAHELAESFQLSQDKNSLYSIIQELRASKSVTPALLDLIDEIRRDANKALHHNPKDQSQVSDFEKSANRCLKIFCEVIALYRLSIQGKTDNKFQMVPDAKADLMQLCYQVMFEDYPDERYRLTRVLRENLFPGRRGDGNYNLQRTMYLQLLEICSDRDGTLMAIRDYSALKLYGDPSLNVKPDSAPDKVIDRLWMLRERLEGTPEIKALFGRAVLVDGLWGEPQRWKIDKAWNYLEESAEADIPLALTSLSLLYDKGIHTSADPDKAIQLLKKSVELDDPSALKMMADIQFSSGEKELAVDNYQKAILAGYPVAALDLAKSLVNLGRSAEAIEAYHLYLNIPYLEHEEIGTAKIALGELIIKEAANNYGEMTNGLLFVVNAVQMLDLSAEAKAAANRVAGIALKKLKGNISREIQQSTGHLLLSFSPDGKIKSLEDLFPENRPPRSDELFDFSAKRNLTLKREKLPKRNDQCPCGSGAKFKRCHGA